MATFNETLTLKLDTDAAQAALDDFEARLKDVAALMQKVSDSIAEAVRLAESLKESHV